MWRTKNTTLSEQFQKYHKVGTVPKIPQGRNSSKNVILGSVIIMNAMESNAPFLFNFVIDWLIVVLTSSDKFLSSIVYKLYYIGDTVMSLW
jgi:hypothetical protein